jgi:hypothetical protein
MRMHIPILMMAMTAILAGCQDRGLKEFAAYKDHPFQPPQSGQQAGALLSREQGLPLTAKACVVPPKGQVVQKTRVADVSSLRAINVSGQVAATAQAVVTAKISPGVGSQSNAKYAGVIQELIPSPKYNVEDEDCRTQIAQLLQDGRGRIYYYHGLLQADEVSLTLTRENRLALNLDVQKPLIQAITPISAGLTLEAADHDTVTVKGTGMYFAYAPRSISISNAPIKVPALSMNDTVQVPGDEWLLLRLVSVDTVSRQVAIEANIRGALPGMDEVLFFPDLSQYRYFWVNRSDMYYRFDIRQISADPTPIVQIGGNATRISFALE